MSVASFRLRRALCASIAVSQVIWSGPLLALDKAACVAAAEEGQRLRQRGQLVAAREQLVVCASPECPPVVSQDCTGWLGEVQRSLTSIVVRARDAAGKPLREVTVVLDGKTLPETAPTAAIEVDPGEHVVRCERPGFGASEQRVQLVEGDRGREINCDMAPVPGQATEPAPAEDGRANVPTVVPAPALQPVPAAPPRASGIPWPVWPLAAVGLGGFAAFGVLEASAQNQQHSLLVSCAPNCTQAQVDPVRTKFALADGAVVVGAVALGAAVLILILHSVNTPSRRGGAAVSRADGLPYSQFPEPMHTFPTQLSLQH
jgi:hypothetical protein